MKMKVTAATLIFGITFGYAASISAQTCSAGPFQGNVSQASATAIAGNTCNHNLNFTAICSNTVGLNGAGLDIYQVAVGAGNNFTINLSSAAFTPLLGFISAACSSNKACLVNQTVAGPDAGTFTSAAQTGLAAGNYYIFVGDSNTNDTTGCGVYNMTIAGTLPVQLKDFSVE